MWESCRVSLTSDSPVDDRAATDELNQRSALSFSSLSLSLSPLLRPLYNSPLDDEMLINNRQVKWRQIEISRPVTTEPTRVFLHYAFFSAVYGHAVYPRPPLFILLRGAYCTIKPAILLLRDGRKRLKHGPVRFSLRSFRAPPALEKHRRSTFPGKINLFPRLNREGKPSSGGAQRHRLLP